MPEGQDGGLLDLEKELTCPICTDVLYQPLTVLDCLHTCCGSCLREWFAWQASKATSSSPYTCPSCRAAVRGTRPNATVTTLLEHLIRIHPEKAKSQDDRDEIAKSYKPGDNVTPPVDIETESEDSEDEQALEQARYLSLRDVDSERTRRRAERSAQNARTRRRHEETARAVAHTPEDLGRAQQPSAFVAQRRQIEHQSSLRSLLSASDIDDEDIREDIMRQIAHEGLLDGVDLSNMTPAQEEEVIERIAQALQRRQSGQTGQSSRPQSRRRTERSPRPASSSHRRHDSQPRSRSNQRGHDRQHHDRPPLSRPHLLGVAAENDRRQRNRSTSRGSQHSHRSNTNVDATSRPAGQPASRSVTDLSSTSGSDTRERPRRASHNSRSTTDPERHALQNRTRREHNTSHDSLPLPSTQSSVEVPPNLRPSARNTEHSASRIPTSPASGDSAFSPPPSRHLRHTSASDPTSSNTEPPTSHPRPARASTLIPPPRPPPAISCTRCGRSEIQYSLHYNCSKCDDGNFNLCLACYRGAKGCNYWFGFGYHAAIRFHRSEWQPNAELPHILSARRYMKRRNNTPIVANNTASDQPSNLEQGLFCDGCLGNANSCYWHCEICLDGAWGYCQTCVAQGKHCTHPLEAMALKSLLCLDTGSPHPPSPPAISSSSPPPDLSSNFSHISSTIKITSPPSSPPQPSHGPLQTNTSAGVGINEIVRVPSILRLRTKLLPSLPNPESYAPLLLPCDCDICHRAIPSSSPRYHCYTCSNGDYDICQPCYATLCSNGKIKPEDAAQGWRRCPQGHRTVMVGFEERERGLRRVVLRDLVGGWALKEDPSAAAATAAVQEQERERERVAGWRWKEQDGRESQAPFAHGDVGVINVQGGNALLPQRTSAGPMVLPPDGGVGLRVQTLWSYFPAEGVEDELAFPKHAEVREAENINGDWFWGVFAGRKGLFPGNYGRVVGY